MRGSKRAGNCAWPAVRPILAILLLLALACYQSARGGDGPGEGLGEIAPTVLPATSSDDGYDVLPLRYADMSKYDQIALEPYKDNYDRMPVGEKAKVYARAFQFMRNRAPKFDPKVTLEVDRFQEASKSKNAIASKQHLYKPPVPKKKVRKKPAEAPSANKPADALLGSLPGPWEKAAPPEPEPEPESEEAEEEAPAPQPQPSYSDYLNDNRMENLREGWNAKDVLRGRRNR